MGLKGAITRLAPCLRIIPDASLPGVIVSG